MKNKGITVMSLVIIIITIIFVLGVISAILFINNNDNNTKSNSTNIENTMNNKVEVNKEENKEKKFWIENYKSWGEQKENCTLKLFDDKITIPYELENLDSFAKKYDYFPDGRGSSSEQNVKTISEVMNLTNKISSDASIYIGYGEYKEKYDKYSKLIQMEVKNFAEEDLTIQECFNRNWWEIASEYSDDLGLDVEVSNNEASKLFDKAIEILGGPKHIYIINRSEVDDKESINYVLSYEYGDYVLEIWGSEIEGLGEFFTLVKYQPKEVAKESLKNIEKNEVFEIWK